MVFELLWSPIDKQNIDYLTSLSFWLVAMEFLWLSMYFARKQFPLGTKFREVMRKTKFFQTPVDAPDEDAAKIARELLAHYPSTVSELVHATDEHGGALFKGLCLVGGLLLVKVDLNHLTAGGPAELLPAWVVFLNLFRIALMIVCLFGFPFFPVWKDWWPKMREYIFSRGQFANWKLEEKEGFMRNIMFQYWHGVLAIPLFMNLPFCDSVLTVRSLILYPPPMTVSDLTLCSGMWGAIRIIRVVGSFTVIVLFLKFTRVLYKGYLYASEAAIKSFYFEYMALMTFIYVNFLAVFESMFDLSYSNRADSLPLLWKWPLLIVAGISILYTLKMLLKNISAIITSQPYDIRSYAEEFRSLKGFEEWLLKEADKQVEINRVFVDDCASPKLKKFIDKGYEITPRPKEE